MNRLVLKSLLLAVTGSVLFPSFGHAYLDPGTGTYVLQMLIAAAVGGGYFVKTNWLRVKLFFAQMGKKDSAANTTPAEPQPNETSK